MFAAPLGTARHGRARHGTEEKPLRLFFRNFCVYRGNAYKLPEQIRYNINNNATTSSSNNNSNNISYNNKANNNNNTFIATEVSDI
jgi:hypothetical protein